MLAQLRALTRGWIARILLGAIALAMAITLFQGDFVRGITGMFNPSGVADVAGESITPQELQREFDLYLRGQQRQGQTMTRPQAIEAHLPERLLDSMIGRIALHKYADHLGIYASDHQVAEALRTIPAAVDQVTGRFNRESYLSFLREVGYTPGEFEADMRADLAGGQVMRSLTAGLRAPTSYGRLLLAFQSERRVVSIAEITPARVGAIPAPTEPQLQTFYEENAQAFAVPEYRALTIVLARAADFAERVDVPEARLREEFEARRAALTQVERRSFAQVTAPDEAKAREAATRLGRGEDPAAIAAAIGGQAVIQNNKAQSEIADSAVAQAAFSMPAGTPPRAVHGRLNWAAVRIDEITAAQAPSFETEREALRTEIALHDAADLMERALEQFDEARGAGTALAEAARASGLTAITVPAVDAQGNTPQRQPAEALTDMPDLIQTAFDTQEGEAADFMPIGEGVDALVQVDRIVPATTRPFAEVRANLVEGWTARERGRLMRELGDQIAASVRSGQTFAAATAAARVPVVVRSQTLDRQTAGQLPDRQLAQSVFGTAKGDVGLALRPRAEGLLVVNVEDIQRADPTQNAQAVERFRQEIQQQVGQSLVEAIQAAATERAKPRRNQQRIDQLFAPADQQQQAP